MVLTRGVEIIIFRWIQHLVVERDSINISLSLKSYTQIHIRVGHLGDRHYNFVIYYAFIDFVTELLML